MTGIVGPNGCGKSNLVEALRWVMGETSARRMRGGDMDDGIFGGTATRPARNIAEVWLGALDEEGPRPAGRPPPHRPRRVRDRAADRPRPGFRLQGGRPPGARPRRTDIVRRRCFRL